MSLTHTTTGRRPRTPSKVWTPLWVQIRRVAGVLVSVPAVPRVLPSRLWLDPLYGRHGSTDQPKNRDGCLLGRPRGHNGGDLDHITVCRVTKSLLHTV